MGKSKYSNNNNNNSNRKRRQTTTRVKITILSLLLILTLVLLLLLSLGLLSLPVGPTSSHHALTSLGRRVLLKGNGMEQWVEILSWQPRAFIYHNFLGVMNRLDTDRVGGNIYDLIRIAGQYIVSIKASKEECEYLITLAKPHLVKSAVVDSKTGKSKDSRVRTSSGMFLRRGQDKVVRDIEKRIADFTFIPVEQGEGLQILRYEEGQKYEPHYDYFLDEHNSRNGGQRIATILMYLSDVEEGGETVFPAAEGNFSSLLGWNERSECGKKGLSVKPKMGDALLFWSMKPDATLDPSSLHGGCPVIKGTKWSSTKWLHVGKYA